MSFNIIDWFTQAEASIKGYINVEEFIKAVVTAISTGGTALGILAAIQAHLATIITDPNLLKEVQDTVTAGISKNWIALTIFLLTLATDLYRRFNHGVTPIIPVPVPVPVPTPSSPNSVKNW